MPQRCVRPCLVLHRRRPVRDDLPHRNQFWLEQQSRCLVETFAVEIQLFQTIIQFAFEQA